MATRLLTDGSTMLLDDCDVVLWDKHFPWRRDKKGYAVIDIRRNGCHSTLPFHQLVAARLGIKGQADHKNRNKLDNRSENLRPATDSQQKANQGRRRDNSSGYKGVSWHAQTNKWRAVIYLNKKQSSLGLFDDEIEAARAYDRAATRLFGEYACLNNV